MLELHNMFYNKTTGLSTFKMQSANKCDIIITCKVSPLYS